MATTVGYVGIIEGETRGVSRLWFSLTKSPDGAQWIKIGAHRAWFTLKMESRDRPTHMAQLTLLLEALRSRLQVRVSHGGAASFHKYAAHDSFEADGVSILRAGLTF
jgi:hypothetical protein